MLKIEMWVAVGAVVLAACDANDQDLKTGGATQALGAAAQPREITDLASAVSQTSAVIEGTVSEIHQEFSDAAGPWTRIVLGDVKGHLGSAPGKDKVELRQFGGLLPNGRLMVAAELPVFVKGQRYLVFLRNTVWNLSPVVGQLAFRVESLEGTEVLVSTDGQPVLGVSRSGTQLGAAVFEPTPYTGQAATAKDGGLKGLDRKPLDRRGFLEALRAELQSQRLTVGGPFHEHPAGAFKWRGQAVTAHGQPQPSTGAGIDTSGSNQ